MRKAKSRWLLKGVPDTEFLTRVIVPAGAQEGEPLNQGGV